MKYLDHPIRLWTNGLTPLRDLPNSASRKLLDIPFGMVVTATGANSGDWIEVVHVTDSKRFVGWGYVGYFEPYAEEYPASVVSIQSPTINPHDAAQYMVWRGKVQYNLCGEICVCYIVQDDLEQMLTKWEAKQINVFKRVFGTGMARGTNAAELNSMLSVYGYEPSISLEAGLRDPVRQRAVITPGRVANMLNAYRAIVGVKISKSTGNLQPNGILHWVVLEAVIPDGINRGWVELYNPFPNRMQRYSWNEFTQSMGAPYGLWVKR